MWVTGSKFTKFNFWTRDLGITVANLFYFDFFDLKTSCRCLGRPHWSAIWAPPQPGAYCLTSSPPIHAVRYARLLAPIPTSSFVNNRP